MSHIASFKLQSFRCYAHAELKDLARGFIVLYGPNGAGKTNILEALSLLSPGRGLRSADLLEIQCQSQGRPWAVSAEVETGYGSVQIGTGLEPHSEKRLVRINGVNAKSQGEMAEHMACIWLSPQMDRLFIEAASQRRKFFDRLVFSFDPGHSGRVTRYENALRQRARLLTEGGADPAWLSALESQMAATGVAIAAARLEFAQRLQRACAAADHTHFPLAMLKISGTLEELLLSAPALEVEDLFKYQLRASQERDAQSGGAATGPHKSDLAVRYAAKNMAAEQCSTGEQKALLIGIILAHAKLIAAERGAPPVLLLDEVAAHLDEGRRAALYDLLLGLGGQVWLTGTDRNLFSALEGRAQFLEVRDGRIQPCEDSALPKICGAVG